MLKRDGASVLAFAERMLAERHLHAAGKAFSQAEKLGADADGCAGGRWQAAMLSGDFTRAWRESDVLRVRAAPDPHRFWAGESIRNRRLMVRCLHGLGDAVQMFRFAPLLSTICSEVIFEVAPRLLPLAGYFNGVKRAITWGVDAPAPSPSWEIQVEVMELTYLFRTTLRDLPIATSYLQLPGEIVLKAAMSMKESYLPRVGLVWASGDWNPQRSIPFSCLASLLDQPAEFWNLQGGESASDAESHPRLRDSRGTCGDGLVALAATIANLDLVITVDTLAAHLAGALGKPAWVLLQHAADWRWMVDRDDTPWYPTMRLFRRSRAGDWPEVLTSVTAELASFLSSEDSRRRSSAAA